MKIKEREDRGTELFKSEDGGEVEAITTEEEQEKITES